METTPPSAPERGRRGNANAARGRVRGRGRGRRGGGRGRGRGRSNNPSNQSGVAPASPGIDGVARQYVPEHSGTAGKDVSASAQSSQRRRSGKEDRKTRLQASEVNSMSQGDVGLSELSEKLKKLMLRGAVECIVCLEKIKREKAIWSCGTCFSIIHLYCAKKWGRQNDLNGEKHNSKSFHCPSCRAPSGDPSKLQFKCYCQRRRNPQLEPGVTPGSCGDPCLRSRGAATSNCPHTCTALCHPGPCSPCIAPAEPTVCHCGRGSVGRRCGDPVPKGGVSCGEVCGRLKQACGHTCPLVCHPGSCQECLVNVSVECYCKGSVNEVPCAFAQSGISCGAVCGRLLSCGNHRCEKICHDGACSVCETSPEVLTHCKCGKRALTINERTSRKSCLDDVPSCGQPCEKNLNCLMKHKCSKVCGHEGDCGSCTERVEAECRCGGTVMNVICGEEASKLREILVCDKKCNDRLLCRSHKCQEICCKFKKRKLLSRPNVASSESLWSEGAESHQHRELSNAERRRIGHGCSERCNKELSCGIHACDLSCGHNGECPPCGILIREPISCACGSESTAAPVRCGTLPPLCRRPCTKIRDCGHACSDSCHHGDCPPCVELVKVDCIGGHGESRFVPCHIGRKGIKCHRACGRSLLCGVHACRKPCHGNYPQECEPSKADACSQPCGLPRNKCEHSCVNMCHPGMLCPETPCRELVIVSCTCGRRREKSMCLRGGTGGLQGGEDSVRLSCDEECTAQMRLRAFASAVGKDGASASSTGVLDSDGAGSEATKYPEFLMRFAENEPGMLSYFEKGLGHIIQGQEKKFVLQALPQLHRLVLHNLAELYCLDSESVGRPNARQLVVRHRGAGIKPVFPRPLLSEAYTQREMMKKKSRQLESGKTFTLHVASSTKFAASADIEVRVKHELRAHSGSYRLVERVRMSSNLMGVMVEFSTSERATLALSSLKSRPGITIETPASGAPIRGSASAEGAMGNRTAWEQTERQAWNDGVPIGRCSDAGGRFHIPVPAPTVDDENVPDSWDD